MIENWKQSARRWMQVMGPDWRLYFFLAAALMGHVLVFYLFRVDYPSVERWVPRTVRVTLLTESNPWASRFLRDLDDRLFHLDPGASTRLAQYSLESQRVMFRPSFADFEIDFLPGPELAETAGPVTLYAAGRPVLPPLPESLRDEPVGEIDAASGAGPGPARFELRTSGALRGRAFMVDRDAVQRLLAARSEGRVRAHATVTPGGAVRILNVLPETGLVISDSQAEWSAEDIDALRRAMRFAPKETLESGWLELAW